MRKITILVSLLIVFTVTPLIAKSLLTQPKQPIAKSAEEIYYHSCYAAMSVAMRRALKLLDKKTPSDIHDVSEKVCYSFVEEHRANGWRGRLLQPKYNGCVDAVRLEMSAEKAPTADTEKFAIYLCGDIVN